MKNLVILEYNTYIQNCIYSFFYPLCFIFICYKNLAIFYASDYISLLGKNNLEK